MAGIYGDTLTNSAGCDSLVVLDLSVEPDFTAIITQTGDSLYAQPNGPGYNFVWLDAAGQPISGATDSLFAPTTDGSYAAVVSSTLCEDTAAYFAFIKTGLGYGATSTSNNGLSIFPNPAYTSVTLLWQQALAATALVSVSDVAGRVWQQHSIAAGTQSAVLDVSGLAAGIYLIKIVEPSNPMTVKRLTIIK